MGNLGKAVLGALALAFGTGASDAPRPLFATAEPLRLTLRAPLLTGKAKPASGTLTVQATGEALPVTLSTRGITRRSSDVCQFPPLRVTFASPPGDASPFAGQKKLKLVTHCQEAASFQQYLLLEYAAYRMYNLLTPASYRVRLAQIDYQDARGKPAVSRLGFFIEDTGDLAKRNGLLEFKTTGRVAPARLSAADAARYAVFQVLISNLDWSMIAGPAGAECCHNSRLAAAKDGNGPLMPLPYDFDMAGMVDPPYSSPPANIHVANVRVRLYRGYCRTNTEARAAISQIVARRAELLGVLDQVPQLSGGSRKKAAGYLGGFFDQVATPAGVDKLLSSCVG